MKIPMGSSGVPPAPSVGFSTRKEIAIGIGATLVFFLTVLFIPLLGLFIGIFTPLPTLLSCYRWGLPLGWWVPAGSILIGLPMLLFLGMTQSISFLMEMVVLGILLGTGMRRQWSAERVIATASLFISLAGLLGLWLAYRGAEGSFPGNLEKDLLETAAAMLQQFGGASAEKQVIEQSMKASIPVLIRILPGAGLASALVISWLNVLLMKRYCRAHGVAQPPWEEWSRWKAPEMLVWGVVTGGLMLVLPVPQLKLPGVNLLIVLGTIYLFQGLSIVTFYLDRWRLPGFFRAIAYAVVVMQKFVTIGTVFLGLFDMWLDFRRLSKPPPEVS